MKILFACSEISPWVKTGGLGDVSFALPKFLKKSGVDIRILIPAYPAIKLAFPDAREIARPHFLGGELPTCSILEAHCDDGMCFYLLDYPPYFERDGNPYLDINTGSGWHDNHLRFALLSRIAAWIGSSVSTINWHPEIIHGNDWQCALMPLYLKHTANTRKCKSLLTVHNLAFQGIFPQNTMASLAIPDNLWRLDGVEFYNNLSFLKAGLQLADFITTVSNSYAHEIQTPEFGCGLEKLLTFRRNNLIGIINGVDESFMPADDKFLTSPFSTFNTKNIKIKKPINRQALRQLLKLNTSPDMPIIGVISRLTHQKGLDLFAEIAEKVLALPAQIVLLGGGDKNLEKEFLALAKKHPQNCSVTIGFNEALSHQIEAGSDIFVMPSRFEPCGLNQMYSQLYGTIPIVRSVGGLKDTVINYSEKNLNLSTGFVFSEDSSQALLQTIILANSVWKNKTQWSKLIENAANSNFSWEQSARKYLNLYQNLIYKE